MRYCSTFAIFIVDIHEDILRFLVRTVHFGWPNTPWVTSFAFQVRPQQIMLL